MVGETARKAPAVNCAVLPKMQIEGKDMLNGAFQRANAIDEISLVVAPSLQAKKAGICLMPA